MIDEARLAERLEALAEHLADWTTDGGPGGRDEMARRVGQSLVALEQASDEADAAQAQLKLDHAAAMAKITQDVDRLGQKLATAVQRAEDEIQRLLGLLAPLEELQAVAGAMDDELRAGANALETAFDGAITQVQEAGDVAAMQLEAAGRAAETAWTDLSEAFSSLERQLEVAVAAAAEQAEAVIPAAARDAEIVGREAMQSVAESVAREIEQGCGRALDGVREEVRLGIDQAVAALGRAIDAFAAEAEGGGVEAQARALMEDLEAIAHHLEEVGQEALNVPQKVAEKLMSLGFG